MTNFVMSANVMLASFLKEQRIEKDLSIAEVALRTRLDPSLISRYESGKRLPTRDHVLRLAHALVMDQEALLVSWLAEKLEKTLAEENVEAIRQKSLALLNGSLSEENLFQRKASKISLSQERVINQTLASIQNLSTHEAETWKRLQQRGRIRLTHDLCILAGNSWEEAAIQAVINEGKTNAEKDFSSHLQLHGMHELLMDMEKLGKTASAIEIHGLIKKVYPHWQESSWKQEEFSLLQLAIIWKDIHTRYPETPALPWIVLSFHLIQYGFPYFSLSKKPITDEEDLIYFSEYLGDWLLTEGRRVI